MRMISILALLMMYGHSTFSDHAIYISVVEIEAQRVRVKVFQDDLQDAIRNYSSLVPDTIRTNYCEQNRTMIEDYFNEKLKIAINNQPMALTYQTSSEEGDSYWISFLYSAPDVWQSIVVEDSHFIELFPIQSNIIKLVYPKQHFCRLSLGEPKCTFEF